MAATDVDTMPPSTENDPDPSHSGSAISESGLDAKRRELGVADELQSIPGVTTPMLVAFGMQGIKSIEDLAGCTTDDLHGWIEEKSGNVTRHAGMLDRFAISRSDCDTIILQARVKAGWIGQ